MTEKFQAKDMTGGLFRNQDKEEGSDQPDYTGYVMIDGVRHRLAGWKKTSKAGSTFLSLKVEAAKDEARQPADDNF
jgi:uncharacterized protein (DUF736 family)